MCGQSREATRVSIVASLAAQVPARVPTDILVSIAVRRSASGPGRSAAAYRRHGMQTRGSDSVPFRSANEIARPYGEARTDIDGLRVPDSVTPLKYNTNTPIT